MPACRSSCSVHGALHSHGSSAFYQPILPNRPAWKQHIRSASNGIKAGLQVLCFSICCFIFLCWGNSPGRCGLAFGGCSHLLQGLSSNLCHHLHINTNDSNKINDSNSDDNTNTNTNPNLSGAFKPGPLLGRTPDWRVLNENGLMLHRTGCFGETRPVLHVPTSS